MPENNIIKSITTHTCPHCDKEIFIESQMEPPVVSSLFTDDDVKKAKADCLERLDTLAIDDEKKEAVEKWLDAPDTVFGPNEVESIILSLLKHDNN
jgi:hypothetical protein